MSNRFVLGGLASVVAFLFLWQQLQATRLGYELESARGLLRQQRENNAYLRLELAQLQSPERIARAAAQRLKMSPPSPESLIFLDSSVERPAERKYLSLLLRAQ